MSVNATVVNDTRYMMQFRFWLDGKKDLESWLADECARLKSIRQFQMVVRNALRLYLSLQAGEIDVLVELFPFAVKVATPPNVEVNSPASRLPSAALPNANLLEVKTSTSKPGNAGRILILQVWLASRLSNVELFTQEDLALVTGHPAFNQALIQAEIARRAKAAPTNKPIQPVDVGNAKKIKGADFNLSAPDFNDLPEL